MSHDRGFLNKTTTATMFIHGKRLRYYGGNYDTFLRVRAENRAHSSAMAKQNERRVAHLKGFIARFQKQEIERTGMPGLKIGFNSVFGYFLEVPRGQVDRVPET